MKMTVQQVNRTAPLSLGVFVSWMLIVYTLSYYPFITESYMPTSIRIGIEGFVLFLLVMINLRYQYLVDLVWFIPLVLIFGCTLLLEVETFVKLISSFNKLVFFILTVELLNGNRSILNTCVKIWIRLSYFLSIAAILAFVGYVTGTIHFPPSNLGLITSGVDGSYYYLHNAFLGNLSPKSLFGIDLARVSGFMYEGGMLANLFCLNIIVAQDWIDNPKKRRMFVRLNFIAGATTLSTTFLLFVGFYLLVKQAVDEQKLKIGVRTLSIFFVGVFLIVLILVSDYLEQTSGSQRLIRMAMYFSVIENSNWLTFMFGNGVNISLDEFQIGIDSGWIAILIERGAILLAFIISLYAIHTKHNRWLLFFICYVNFAFNMFWAPAYLLVIAMSHASFLHKRTGSHRLHAAGLALQPTFLLKNLTVRRETH